MQKSQARSDQVLHSLRKIARAVDRDSKRMRQRVGLTGPELLILREVSGHSEVSMGDLARDVALTRPTLTYILERMVKRGLVDRRRNDRDRRRVMVWVTDNGRELLQKAPPMIQDSFMDQYNQLAEGEQTMILEALDRLASLLENQAAD